MPVLFFSNCRYFQKYKFFYTFKYKIKSPEYLLLRVQISRIFVLHAFEVNQSRSPFSLIANQRKWPRLLHHHPPCIQLSVHVCRSKVQAGPQSVCFYWAVSCFIGLPLNCRWAMNITHIGAPGVWQCGVVIFLPHFNFWQISVRFMSYAEFSSL